MERSGPRLGDDVRRRPEVQPTSAEKELVSSDISWIAPHRHGRDHRLAAPRFVVVRAVERNRGLSSSARAGDKVGGVHEEIARAFRLPERRVHQRQRRCLPADYGDPGIVGRLPASATATAGRISGGWCREGENRREEDQDKARTGIPRGYFGTMMLIQSPAQPHCHDAAIPRLILCEGVVREAVEPSLAGFGGGDDGVLRRARVFAGVAVRG